MNRIMTARKSLTVAFLMCSFAASASEHPADEPSLRITFGSAMEVEGVGTFKKNESFIPTNEPCVLRMRPVLKEGERTYAIDGTDAIVDGFHNCRFPLQGEDGWVRVALAGTETNYTFTALKATDVRYADAEHGKNDWDGTADWEHRNEILGIGPKLSLQAACDVSTGNYPVVIAAAGFYTNAVTRLVSDGHVCLRRLSVNKRIQIRSAEGAERTFIVGAPDPVTGGRGDNAIAGVWLTSPSSCGSCLQGFTITGCYTPDEAVKTSQYGAAVSSGGFRVYVQDCVISNNCAYSCGATSYVIINRSRIVDNEAYQYVARFTYSTACVYAGNRLTIGNRTSVIDALFYRGTQQACTIDLRNSLNPEGRYSILRESTLADSVVCGFRGTMEPSQGQNVLLDADPIFADADARDYRLGALSPALDALDYAELDVQTRKTLVADVAKRMLTLRDGKARLGAEWNDPLPVSVIVSAGGGVASSTGRIGTNVVLSADEITVTATDAAHRPLRGFVVNGELQPFAGNSIAVTPSVDSEAITSVKAVYGTEWYVDCTTGDDANSGGVANFAKATIRAATTNAMSGDVIHVAKGSYGAAEGSQKHTSKATLETRVVVPAGVTLIGEDPETTFIVGQASVTPEDDFGNGPGAVRCVYLGADAAVRGFTLTGGRTYGLAPEGGIDEDLHGGAVLGESESSATVEECVVSNNACNVGNCYAARILRCRVLGNVAVAQGGAGSYCGWYGCVLDNNRCMTIVRNPVVVDTCTLGANNATTDGVAKTYACSCTDSKKSYPMYNTVVLYGRFYGKASATNCAFLSSMISTHLKEENCSNCVWLANAAAAKVGADYRLAADSPLIDKGDAALSGRLVGMDLDGFPRILNGALDIGACEYDWRPAFGRALGRWTTVSVVSPAVCLSGGRLWMPSGEIAGTIGRDGMGSAAFEIIGTGVLSLYIDDKLAGEFVRGDTEANFGEVGVGTEFRFVYTPGAEDGGGVFLDALGARRGMLLIVR